MFMINFYLLFNILFFQQSLAADQSRNFGNIVPKSGYSDILNTRYEGGDQSRNTGNVLPKNGFSDLLNTRLQSDNVPANDNKPSQDDIQQKEQRDNTPQLEENQVEPTTFEIKAILTKCPKPRSCDCESTFQCASNETDSINLRTNDLRSKCEEQDDNTVLRNCDKKITLTLKIKNRGLTNCKPQYIILDHVFDASTDKKQKLLNPYVLKITQRPVFQTYDLLFENVVNSGPSERVVNKNDEGYSGCSTDPSNPTCGSVKYHSREVPYSSGFCCSCLSPPNGFSTESNLNDNSKTITSSSYKALQLNDRSFDQKDISNLGLPNLNEPAINDEMGFKETNLPYLPEYNKIDYGHDGFVDKSGKLKENDLTINAQNMIPDNLGSAPRIGRQSLVKDIKDNTLKKRIHKRGGQNCDDTYTPPGADPDTYHESAHCMEFSDVWYSIYKIAHPDIDHSLEIQIFEKIGMKGNRIYWREVTSSGVISVGTTNQRYASDDGTILAYYSINKQIESEFALDCKIHRLLIPEVTGREANEDQFPEVRGGPPEYLVVKEDDIDLSGKSCNKAGVGYEAFAKQPSRCESDRNACLQNQPKQMWQHDHDLEANGRKGCYFLKNYGILPENPVFAKPCNGSSKKTQNKILYMFYLPCLSSSVNINFAADMNVVLRSDALAMITEVYTETLNPKRVTVTAKILNSGLVTSIFYVGIGACPMDVPASFGSITSQPVLIAPQHQHTFTLVIYCELPRKNFYCSLEVFNMKQQLISVRRIRFERQDRCICVWHCQCTCFASDYSLKCSPLEIEQYHAAGFQGGMPISTQVVNYSDFDDTISVILHIILYFCLTLWYMGLIKAMLGCCILPIGLWGLDKILDLPKKLNKYYEPELKDQEVVYDDDGWPVHPETGKKVHNVAPAAQFAINMVFFFIFPFALIWNLCKKLLAPKYAPDEMFSDLDICKCRASQISLLKDYSLQNSTLKNNNGNNNGSNQRNGTYNESDRRRKGNNDSDQRRKGNYDSDQRRKGNYDSDQHKKGNYDSDQRKKGIYDSDQRKKGPYDPDHDKKGKNGLDKRKEADRSQSGKLTKDASTGGSNSLGDNDSKTDGKQDDSKKKRKGCIPSRSKSKES